MDNNKNTKKSNIKKIIFIIAIIIFIICVIIFSGYYYLKSQSKKRISNVQNYSQENIQNSDSDNIESGPEKSELQLKIEELQKENSDIKGWIKIDDTVIDYPVLQGNDNEYYLKHDYTKKYSYYGSIYLKTGCNIDDSNSNLIIYGHNMKDEEMFNCLLKYQDKEFYDSHKTINITTGNEEREYEIVSAFKSRIFYQDETNVFRYYNYLNFKDEQEYNSYVANIKKIQCYDTGVTANFGEQLITLITCEYSQENGRMVVVAKRIR